MKRVAVSFMLLLAVLALGVLLGMHYERRRTGEPETIVVTRVDTLVRVDTLHHPYPVPVEVRVVDSIPYPVPVPGPTDTVWAQLPREQKVYADSTYRAVVSGFQPSLDSIDVYNREVFVSRDRAVYVQPGRWSVGVQAGVGVAKDGLSPYIGVGVQYRLFSFPACRQFANTKN